MKFSERTRISKQRVCWCIIDYSDAERCGLKEYTCTSIDIYGGNYPPCPDLLMVVEVGRCRVCVITELKLHIEDYSDLPNVATNVKKAEEQLESNICISLPHCCKDTKKAIILKGVREILDRPRDDPKRNRHFNEIYRICREKHNYICVNDPGELYEKIEIYMRERKCY